MPCGAPPHLPPEGTGSHTCVGPCARRAPYAALLAASRCPAQQRADSKCRGGRLTLVALATRPSSPLTTSSWPPASSGPLRTPFRCPAAPTALLPRSLLLVLPPRGQPSLLEFWLGATPAASLSLHLDPCATRRWRRCTGGAPLGQKKTTEVARQLRAASLACPPLASAPHQRELRLSHSHRRLRSVSIVILMIRGIKYTSTWVR